MILSVSDISKTFGEETILDGISFDLRATDRVALVGPNGAGKSTLLKILTAELASDSGSVELSPSMRIGYVQQHVKFPPESTVWDEACKAAGELTELISKAEAMAKAVAEEHDPKTNAALLQQYDRLQTILQQRDAYQWEHTVNRVLSGMGFVGDMLTMPVSSLSGGQRNRLLLACILIGKPDLLILDEPSNHLDIETTEWLEQTLADYPSAVLIVSHDRYFLDSIANSVYELVNGTIETYKGNYSAYVTQKRERLEVQRRTYEKQTQEIEKLEDFIRKHGVGQKATQAEDRRKKLARIERVDLPREISVPRFGFPKATRTGDIVLQADSLSKSFDSLQLFDKLSFQIERGERWAIVGSNGTGKSTLLKCILGHEPLDQGSVRQGTGVKIGYFDQLLSQLNLSMTPAESIRVAHKETVDLVRRKTLAKFGIQGDLANKPLSTLSGGERNRTLLALLSELDANVLILDEPTNHLDLWSREALESAIREFDGTVILVSHDRYLVNAIADHLLVLHAGQAKPIVGNYETYRDLLRKGLTIDERGQGWGETHKSNAKANSSESTNAAPITSPKEMPKEASSSQTQTKRRRKFKYRKIDDIENDIGASESRIEAIHLEMTDPAALRDGDVMKSLASELSDIQEKLVELYEHYEEALELN